MKTLAFELSAHFVQTSEFDWFPWQPKCQICLEAISGIMLKLAERFITLAFTKVVFLCGCSCTFRCYCNFIFPLTYNWHLMLRGVIEKFVSFSDMEISMDFK